MAEVKVNPVPERPTSTDMTEAISASSCIDTSEPVPETLAKVREVLAWLEAHRTEKDRENLIRFGIYAKYAMGVSVSNIQLLAGMLGRNHDLALALWSTGFYEARMLCAFIDETQRVTPEQMDSWCHQFDNWGICDTVCFHLFDRTQYAWDKVALWRNNDGEFSKRAAFALLASLAGHDKTASDEQFLQGLQFIEVAAQDERNFVKKAVNWALRRVGGRGPVLRAAAIEVAQRLAASPQAAPRWVGKDALREFMRPKAVRCQTDETNTETL